MPDYDTRNAAQSRNSIRSLNAELSNLTPSSIITLFEIDIRSLAKDLSIDLEKDAQELGLTDKSQVEEGILRFHNNIKVFNSYITWQGKAFFPAPIMAEGFESTTKGSTPQPTLSLATNTEDGISQLNFLKYQIRKMGDIVGAKVTRKRTFAKYLDSSNFGISKEAKIGAHTNSLPDGYEPDPFAYLPSDVYFIERKQTENKANLVYQLSSVLDLENIKLPKRTILADKCSWQYRGLGCWYQHPYNDPELEKWEKYINGEADGENLPLLERAGLDTLRADGKTDEENDNIKNIGMLKNAPPAATDADLSIWREAGNQTIAAENFHKKDKGLYSANENYDPGNYVYTVDETTKVKYYFVCRRTLKQRDGGTPKPPPNKTFWVADQCSKTLQGCRLRWGATKSALYPQGGSVNINKGGCEIPAGELPFGGFPAAKKISRGG